MLPSYYDMMCMNTTVPPVLDIGCVNHTASRPRFTDVPVQYLRQHQARSTCPIDSRLLLHSLSVALSLFPVAQGRMSG